MAPILSCRDACLPAPRSSWSLSTAGWLTSTCVATPLASRETPTTMVSCRQRACAGVLCRPGGGASARGAPHPLPRQSTHTHGSSAVQAQPPRPSRAAAATFGSMATPFLHSLPSLAPARPPRLSWAGSRHWPARRGGPPPPRRRACAAFASWEGATGRWATLPAAPATPPGCRLDRTAQRCTLLRGWAAPTTWKCCARQVSGWASERGGGWAGGLAGALAGGQLPPQCACQAGPSQVDRRWEVRTEAAGCNSEPPPLLAPRCVQATSGSAQPRRPAGRGWSSWQLTMWHSTRASVGAQVRVMRVRLLPAVPSSLRSAPQAPPANPSLPRRRPAARPHCHPPHPADEATRWNPIANKICFPNATPALADDVSIIT